MLNKFENLKNNSEFLNNLSTNIIQQIIKYSKINSKADINYQNSFINNLNTNSMLLNNIENNIENYNINSYLNKKRYNFCLKNNKNAINFNEKNIINNYINLKNIIEQNNFINEVLNNENLRNYILFNNLNKIFKDKINIEKLNDLIKYNYDKKLENNTNYKYINPNIFNNLINYIDDNNFNNYIDDDYSIDYSHNEYFQNSILSDNEAIVDISVNSIAIDSGNESTYINYSNNNSFNIKKN